MNIKPFSTMGIGSMPHTEARLAAGLALQTFDIPFWPQLPKLSFLEGMIPQYSEGMPGIRFDHDERKYWLERDEEEIARFYETCGEMARISISEDYAAGFYAFLKLIETSRYDCLKGHITGPLTFTLGLKDLEGRAIFYDEELREIALMLMKAKARWQVDMLKKFSKDVVIFIDEPILSSLGGTSYMGVGDDEVRRMLHETAEAIREAGGIAGIHCCGRADWPLVLKSGVDIMNFDAYSYAETLGIYPAEVTKFLEDGGMLAWGIVPTTDDIEKESEESIIKKHDWRINKLSETISRDLLNNGIILTPSCGAGSLSVEDTHKAFQLLIRLKEHCVG